MVIILRSKWCTNHGACLRWSVWMSEIMSGTRRGWKITLYYGELHFSCWWDIVWFTCEISIHMWTICQWIKIIWIDLGRSIDGVIANLNRPEESRCLSLVTKSVRLDKTRWGHAVGDTQNIFEHHRSKLANHTKMTIKQPFPLKR